MHPGVSIKQILSQSAVKTGQAELSRCSAASFCRREERWQNQSLTHTHTSKMPQKCDWARPDFKDSLGKRNLCWSFGLFLYYWAFRWTPFGFGKGWWWWWCLFSKENEADSLISDPFLFTSLCSHVAGQVAFRTRVSATPRKSTAVEPFCEAALQETG